MKKLLAVVNPKSGTGNQEQIPDLLDSVIDKSRFSVDVRVVQAEGDAYRFGRRRWIMATTGLWLSEATAP